MHWQNFLIFSVFSGFSVFSTGQLAHGAFGCPTALLAGNRVNDPVDLRSRQRQNLASLTGFAGGFYTDYAVSTLLVPMSPQTLFDAYASGWKIYHHFDVEGAVPEWENPAFRGIMTFNHSHDILRGSSIIKEIKKLSQRNGKPIYTVRFNHDVRRVITAAASAERAMQNTTTKEYAVDGAGHSLRWTKTWLSPEIQNAFVALIEAGHGYTVEIYTNEFHPFHDQGVGGGHLVGGTFGIEVNGAYTGISLFMNRDTYPNSPTRERYDGVGKLAFLIEMDALESQGVAWLDTVAVNSLPRALGAYFVNRGEFQELLVQAKKNRIKFQVPDSSYILNFDRWLK